MLLENLLNTHRRVDFRPKNLKIINEDGSYIDATKFLALEKTISKIIKHKSLILFLGDNDAECLAFYFILFRLQHCQILLENNIEFSNLNKIIRKFKPDYIFISRKIKISEKFRIVKKFNNFNLLENINKKKVKVHHNLAILISTSGSTGDSKFVKLSFENIIENTISIQDYLKLKKSDIGITTLPISYSYGMSVVNLHLFQDLKIISCKRSVFENKFWDLIKSYKVTNFSGVPASFEILDKIKFYNKEFFKIRFLTQAGGKLDEVLAKKIFTNLKKKKIDFYIMYGQTEASPRITFLETKYFLKKIGSVGKPIKGGKIKINKKRNVIGEIIYYGKNIFKGYATSRSDLLKLSNFENLETGDLGYLDKDGFLFITGRKNREAKIGGKRVNLDLIEKFLYKKIKRRFVCLEKKMILYVISCINLSENLIKNELFKEFSLSMQFIKILKVDSFPLNKNNKINYSKIKIKNE